MGNKIIYDGHTFEHADIEEGNLYRARALLSDSLEIDTFEVTIKSTDTTLAQFTRNAPFTYFYNDTQVGTYYVQSINRIAANKYKISCTSTVGLLDQTDHNGGIYTGQTVQEVVSDICGSHQIYVKSNLQDIALYGWLPIASRRDNLSQVLFAIGAALKVDHNGVLRVEGLWGEQSAKIGRDSIFEGGTVEYGTPVTQVVVTEHQYIEGGEEATLFEGTTSDGDKITFDEPCYGLTAVGFTICEQGANYAIVSSGNGTLTGHKYIHNTRMITKQITAADTENAVKAQDATLVSLANANAIAERLAAYYSCTGRVTHDIVTDTEAPGDVVSLVHPFGGDAQACIESSDVNLSTKLRATEKFLLGYIPPDISAAEYYDRADLITEDGTWTVPEGVTSIRAVLIGGGQGGAHGADGEDGARDYSGGAGGQGGEGGAGGGGGKILQQELSVTEGTSVPVSIGIGGDAAADISTQGAEGSATIFGSLSSDQGASSVDGFTDIITGEAYAKPGEAGIAGGSGGDGGNGSRHGENGEAVGDASGGAGGQTQTYTSSAWTGNGWAGGGGGGGAAHQTLGGNGSDGRGGGTIRGGNGGEGATPGAADTVIKFGCGGHGGHGGGGGGGGGGAHHPEGSSYQWAGSGGAAGTGGKGSAGANGCVIIYYRAPKIVNSGRIVTRDGKIFIDKHARKLVV